jgi:co-chaperonin GroES (HSP10)
LYGSYGYVNYPFNPQFGDKIVMQDLAGNSQELNVYSASTGSGILSIVVYPKVLDDWSIDQKKINTFLLLKQYEDEQNVILTFNKQEGKTSYGFLIPDTINKNVINQINSIQASVQSQILSTQANSDTLDAILGGTFGG